MKRATTWMKAALVVPVMAAGMVVGTGATSQADDDVVCRGTIGTRVIDGNVVVPRNATCRLVRMVVDGDVKAGSGAVLKVEGARIDGNIQTSGARQVFIAGNHGVGTRVDGNIQLKNGTRGGYVRLAVVKGDIQLFSNRGRFDVRRNIVDGNLQCKGNKPAPTGAKNRVDGNKENQCRRF
ncbi:hypothetical protein [Nocardioides sp. Root190]|uniref:hypothetical protein n=1 Tax=Nocardioides sp. Root190 TaxID=1736488 RepID=UPI0009EA4DCD|nr:hypothetical protein [Nocardioides sp. Root190]